MRKLASLLVVLVAGAALSALAEEALLKKLAKEPQLQDAKKVMEGEYFDEMKKLKDLD
jgi:hypothetical protein